MAGISITVEGFAEGIAAIQAALDGARLEKGIEKYLREVPEILKPAVEQEIAATTVARSGVLGGSVNTRVTPRTAKAGPDAYYARWVEFGTRRGLRERRFMREALAKSKGRIVTRGDEIGREFAQGRGL